MSGTLNLKCTCGKVKGIVKNFSPSEGNHISCLCDDCQVFARYLGREKDILDPNGGTEIYQLTPTDMHITQGVSELHCIKLTEKGLIRWYADCCKTPVANTVSGKFPFAGVVHNFIVPAPKATSLDSVLGPVIARIQGKYGYGTLLAGTHQTIHLKTMWRILKIFLKAKVAKKKHSPFFDATV